MTALEQQNKKQKDLINQFRSMLELFTVADYIEKRKDYVTVRGEQMSLEELSNESGQ